MLLHPAPEKLRGMIGGSGEIRTHGGRKSTTVFKTVALNRSATLPEPRPALYTTPIVLPSALLIIFNERRLSVARVQPNVPPLLAPTRHAAALTAQTQGDCTVVCCVQHVCADGSITRHHQWVRVLKMIHKTCLRDGELRRGRFKPRRTRAMRAAVM